MNENNFKNIIQLAKEKERLETIKENTKSNYENIKEKTFKKIKKYLDDLSKELKDYPGISIFIEYDNRDFEISINEFSTEKWEIEFNNSYGDRTYCFANFSKKIDNNYINYLIKNWPSLKVLIEKKLEKYFNDKIIENKEYIEDTKTIISNCEEIINYKVDE